MLTQLDVSAQGLVLGVYLGNVQNNYSYLVHQEEKSTRITGYGKCEGNVKGNIIEGFLFVFLNINVLMPVGFGALLY